MHIAFLTPEYPHERIGHSGGMGTSISNLAKALTSQNVQVTVFVYSQKESVVFQDHGITFHLIAHKNFKLGGFYRYRKYIEKYINRFAADFDLIEAPDWTGITAFMRFDVPLVIRCHGSDTYFCHIEQRAQKWKNQYFERRAMKAADAFIAPTHFAGTTTMDLFNLPQDQLQVIPYGLELEQFVNLNPEQYEPLSLLNIGTLIRKKGVFQLVAMFNKLVLTYENAQLHLIGGDSGDVQTGASSTWTLIQHELSEQALKNTTYHGKVPYNQVQEKIKKAHVCLFPSLAETLGMVTIESMALHKAVVNTSIGWAQDLINDGEDGFLRHPNHINEWVHKITDLFENPQEVQRIGAAAVKRTHEDFDIQKIVHQNIDFYKSLIK
ncbi:glycosyltransferase family 4 protein [Nonlabens xiamenensis]|uniref:glycosyltransferase family 4 protein n=1 Tax=Nonlabens xiamenensis TaxID=2341043 RepID=UPI000F60591D|nr:glycosyltransferase family 4 protein [Nonlabens xiamenensis]